MAFAQRGKGVALIIPARRNRARLGHLPVATRVAGSEQPTTAPGLVLQHHWQRAASATIERVTETSCTRASAPYPSSPECRHEQVTTCRVEALAAEQSHPGRFGPARGDAESPRQGAGGHTAVGAGNSDSVDPVVPAYSRVHVTEGRELHLALHFSCVVHPDFSPCRCVRLKWRLP